MNTYEGDHTSDFRDFSDGQYQSIYIYALTEIFKNIEGGHITLLDEPDAFFHPEWQLQFLAQVAEIASGGGDTDNNHILMTSHSAASVAPKSISSTFRCDHGVGSTKASITSR
ncbi:MAG: AAA family ATPase [Terasakiella sp.]|uniref:AAA family ATPase n=1 Tax=unclassified Terasakiella TaxID=2614952 RepID=UPI003AFFDEAC